MFSSQMTEETGESISPYDQVTDPFNCNISFKLFPTSASMGPWALADQEIQSSSRAFSALRKDGQVITWGHPECGGNSCNLEQSFVKLMKMKHVIADHKLKCFIPHVVLWKAVESLNLEVETFCTSSAFWVSSLTNGTSEAQWPSNSQMWCKFNLQRGHLQPSGPMARRLPILLRQNWWCFHVCQLELWELMLYVWVFVGEQI